MDTARSEDGDYRINICSWLVDVSWSTQIVLSYEGYLLVLMEIDKKCYVQIPVEHSLIK